MITCPLGLRRSTWVKASDTAALLRCTDPLPCKPDHRYSHLMKIEICFLFHGYDDNYLFENHYILSQRPSLVAAQHNINSL